MKALQVLVVDDEALARLRLKTLLADCREPAAHLAGEAASVDEALQCLGQAEVDLVLADIHMPGRDGLALAQALQTLAQPPALVFVTAHGEHALQAFELDALDYLTKPVRLERLQQALQKVGRLRQGPASADSLLIHERGRTERVPLAEVLYLKAEWKYLTVRTRARQHLLEASLADIESRYPAHFIRIHRNALVARQAVRALERCHEAQEGEAWAVRLEGLDELLTVSRRQLAAVRGLLAAAG